MGFLIFVVVENNDDQKTHEINHPLERLSEATDKIQNGALVKLDQAILDIKNHISSLKLIPTLHERLDVIGNIVKHAQEKDNELYILSYSPNYGQYVMSNLKIIIDESNKQAKVLDKITHKQFFKDLMLGLLKRKKDNKEAIIDYSNNNNKLHLAILRSVLVDSVNPDKFKEFIEERILNNKKVLLIDPIREREILTLPENSSWENTFVYAVEKVEEMNIGNEAKKASARRFNPFHPNNPIRLTAEVDLIKLGAEVTSTIFKSQLLASLTI